jgi:hypothetical protein
MVVSGSPSMTTRKLPRPWVDRPACAIPHPPSKAKASKVETHQQARITQRSPSSQSGGHDLLAHRSARPPNRQPKPRWVLRAVCGCPPWTRHCSRAVRQAYSASPAIRPDVVVGRAPLSWLTTEDRLREPAAYCWTVRQDSEGAWCTTVALPPSTTARRSPPSSPATSVRSGALGDVQALRAGPRLDGAAASIAASGRPRSGGPLGASGQPDRAAVGRACGRVD